MSIIEIYMQQSLEWGKNGLAFLKRSVSRQVLSTIKIQILNTDPDNLLMRPWCSVYTIHTYFVFFTFLYKENVDWCQEIVNIQQNCLLLLYSLWNPVLNSVISNKYCKPWKVAVSPCVLQYMWYVCNICFCPVSYGILEWVCNKFIHYLVHHISDVIQKEVLCN